VLLLGGCSQILGIGELSGPDDAGATDAPGGGDAPAPAVDCKVQRVVHIIAGNGGFAWFTLVWPAPAVITSFQPTFAYDDPGNAANATTDPAHPLFARRIGARALWDGLGQDPQPSVFIAGSNETHTSTPQSIVRAPVNGTVGAELVAAGAALQGSLAPPLPVLAFARDQPYGPAPGAPTTVLVTDVEGAITALRATGALTPAIEQQVRPSAAQLASYVAPGAPQASVTLATELAFTANAFHFGLIGSVIMPAFNDDPHGAFSGGIALPAQRANDLATTLDAFYRDLATGSEPLCGRGGNFLSLADNVVLIATGDTPKNSFDNAGWADGTPGGSNWMYLRSNGFTKPGWFGQVTPGARTNFEPFTGQLDPMTATASSTAAAFAGALYAIARGDRAAVQAVTPAPFDGVILH
jgi:hypothetical protein